jgi:hypothetical protein
MAMKLEEIKAAVLAGKIVHWASNGYIVKHHPKRDWFYILCTSNDNICGLTHRYEDQCFIGTHCIPPGLKPTDLI